MSIIYKRIALSLGVIVFAGAVVAGGTGAFFSDTASSNSNTFASGSMNLQVTENEGGNSPTEEKNAVWNFSELAPGGDEVEESVWLRNTGSIEGESINVALDFPNGGGNNNFAEQLRLTKLTWDGSNLLEGGAGATIPAYEAPTHCDVEVNFGNNDETRITNAVDNAAAGDVLCVGSGNYSASWEPGSTIPVDEEVAIVSMEGPDSTQSIPFDVSADNVTIKGFEVTGDSDTYGVRIEANNNVTVTHNVFADLGTNVNPGSVQAIYYNAGDGNTGLSFAAEDLEFSYNRFSNIGNTSMLPGSGSSAKAIYVGDTAGEGEIENVTIAHNIINGVFTSGNTYSNGGRGAYGFMVNFGGNTKNLVVEHNSIENLSGWWSTAIGLEGRTQNAVVELNDIDALGAAGADNDTGVNFESNISAASVPVNQNNFDSSIDGVIINPNFTSFNGTIDATNNWWGDFDPSDQVFEHNGTIDTSNHAMGPFSGLVNGNDQNGNGYADLHDLKQADITNATPGLASYTSGEDKEFVAAVQLDASTGNSFQGQSLSGIDFTFTLNQIENQ